MLSACLLRFYCEVCILELLLLSENKDMTGKIISDYQVFLLNNLLCVAAPCVLFDCYFDVFLCLELQVCLLSLLQGFFFESKPESEPTLELHFFNFQSCFPSAVLYAILLYSPLRLARVCKSHIMFESFYSYLTNLFSFTTALLLLAK